MTTVTPSSRAPPGAWHCINGPLAQQHRHEFDQSRADFSNLNPSDHPKDTTMKTARISSLKALLPVAAALAMFSNPLAHAESQYGYSPAGNNKVTAQATVKISVTVPTLILLRVGDAKAPTELKFSAVPNATGAPLSAELSAITSDVSNQAAAWDGTAPTFATPDAQKVGAWAWTNNKDGGELAVKTTVDTALNGMDATSITVQAVAGDGALPAHGATTATATLGKFEPNKVHSATWLYSVDPTALAGAVAGTYAQTSVYTATAL